MLTVPDCAPLFPMFPEWDDGQEPVVEQRKSVPALDPCSLIIMTPTSPILDSFYPSQLLVGDLEHTNISSVAAKPPAIRRKVSATGIRKGITPESLLDESAPTQSPNYVTPSATSRKEVPAIFTRKRARSMAFSDEEDQLDDDVLPPNPTEKDLIEQKRRQNAVAARSRKRKLEHLQLLETSLEKERQLKEQSTPSATSRKEVPAVFSRKRARSTAFGDEEDELDDDVLPPNPTEKDLIEQKRRQNTVAARRSRERKLEHLQLLETSLEKDRQLKEQW